ncbi:MAG: MFS transporter [Planctomycetota bacterium]
MTAPPLPAKRLPSTADPPVPTTAHGTPRDLRLSVLDGASHATMVGFGESFTRAFAVHLGGSNFFLALLASVPLALGALSQLFTAALVRRFRSRHRVTWRCALLQGLSWFAVIAALAAPAPWPFALLFAGVLLYWVGGLAGNPAWNSWMGDLVRAEDRAVYFGHRSRVCQAMAFLGLVGGGLLLQFFEDRRHPDSGFALIFMIAAAMRFVSVAFLYRINEPVPPPAAPSTLSFTSFLRQLLHQKHGSLVLYMACVNLALYAAAPYYAPYMLRDMRLSFLEFAAVTGAAVAAKFLSLPLWGRLADRHGTHRMMKLAGLLLPVWPLLWVFATSLPQLIAIELCAGLFAAGFEITTFTFLFELTTRGERLAIAAYSNILSGFGMILGTLIGLWLADSTLVAGMTYQGCFAASAVLRLMSVALLGRMKDVRIVEALSARQMFLRFFSLSNRGPGGRPVIPDEPLPKPLDAGGDESSPVRARARARR